MYGKTNCRQTSTFLDAWKRGETKSWKKIVQTEKEKKNVCT